MRNKTIKKAYKQRDELNKRLANGEHYETVLDDIYDTDDETYADFNCETFSGTYLIKENRIGEVIDVWKFDDNGDIIGYITLRIQ